MTFCHEILHEKRKGERKRERQSLKNRKVFQILGSRIKSIFEEVF